MWRLAGPAAVGAAIGILWLTFLGVPFIIPSYLSVRADLGQAQADLKATGESFDDSENLRRQEGGQCRDAVEAERDYWLREIRRRDARQAHFDAAGTQETENEEAPLSGPDAGLCDGFDFVSGRELHQPAAGPGTTAGTSAHEPGGLRRDP